MLDNIYSPVVTAVVLVCGLPRLLCEVCLLGEFPAQVRQLQSRVMMTDSDVTNASRLFDDVSDTLRRRWKDAEIFAYGSLATRVAMKMSDADCTFKIPNDNATSESALISEASELFRSQPDLYSQVMVLSDGQANHNVLVTVYHKPTGRYCDLTYYNAIGLYSSRLFGYYINLDKRVPPLVLILKFWSRIHQITGPEVLTNYGLYTLIMFYLQQKKIGPPVSVVQKDTRNNVDDIWNLNFNKIPYKSNNTESLYQLLGGFFKYYSEFDFKEYIVSPFVGRPVLRREFADINTVPAEFTLYKSYMSANDRNPLNITTDICIQEPFEHNKNAANRVAGENTFKIMSHFKFCAKMFEQLSSDRFLRSILIKDKHNEKYERSKKIVFEKIAKLEDCINE